MHVNLEIGGGRVLEASTALMVYRGGPQGAYAIRAPVLASGPKGKIKTGPWEPVTLEFVRSLAKGLGVDVPREVLPADVLCRTNDVIAWWTPPGIRTLYFTDDKLKKFDGEDFPVPGLIWRLDLAEGRLYMRAIKGAQRPEASTQLYVSPFLNVYNHPGSGGLVCQGTMRRPKSVGLENVFEWEEGFFGAAGSSQLAKDATSRRGGLFALWASLKGKKRCPGRYLVDAGESLLPFIRRER